MSKRKTTARILKLKMRFKNILREKRLWFFGGVVILSIWIIMFLLLLPDGKLRLLFCDVGQGDGIYIDLPDGSDVLIDGGPNQKILDCLGENMPFWDRKLEMVVLTHPQADHLNGLIEVVKRYEVGYFVASPIGNETKGYKELIGLIQKKNVPVRNVYAGDKIKFKAQGSRLKANPKLLITNLFRSETNSLVRGYELRDEVAFRVLWPSREYIVQNTAIDSLIAKNSKYIREKVSNIDSVVGNLDRFQKEEKGQQQAASQLQYMRVEVPQLQDSNILGLNTVHADLNDFSIVLELKFGEFEAFLGADADEKIQDDILAASKIRPVEVFKVPHHGSKNGILDKFIDYADAKLAVISVGKNRWGHPADEIIKKLADREIKLFRTDKDGNVKIITDGSRFWVENDRN